MLEKELVLKKEDLKENVKLVIEAYSKKNCINYLSVSEVFYRMENDDIDIDYKKLQEKYKDRTPKENKEFYMWLKTGFKNDFRSYNVLLFLLRYGFNNDKKKLERFVFNEFIKKKIDNESIYIPTQKWHYYISYFALNEYRNKNFILNPNSEIYTKFKCKELIRWLKQSEC